VSDTERSRCDLIAINDSGDIVVIEIKRDVEDIKRRKESFEFQAMKYVSAYAKIKTREELVSRIFAPYVEKHKSEYSDLKNLNPKEIATRKLNEFLRETNALDTFNKKQIVILVASEFDNQTLSTVAWLCSNNDIRFRCIKTTPVEIGSKKLLKIEKIIPPTTLEDFYTEVPDKIETSYEPGQKQERSSTQRVNLPRMPKLFEWGLLKKGDILELKGHEEDSAAEVVDPNTVKYKNIMMTYNQWGQKITGWSSICIYEWAKKKGTNETIGELRDRKMQEQAKEKDV